MKQFILAFLFPLTVSAHVTVETNVDTAGSYAKLIFRVPHGCEGSSTVKITVELPEGILSVKPQVHSGWTITTKEEKLNKPATLHGRPINETTTEVSWAGGPLPDKYMDEFGMAILLPDKAGQKLFFPVVQNCEKGISKWIDTKNPKSPFPAPFISLKEAVKTDEHHSSH